MRIKVILFLEAIGLLILVLNAPAAGTKSTDWNVAVLDQLLASTPAGQTLAHVGDMMIPASYLQAWRNHLAGGPQPNLAFSGTFNPWTDGKVYYAFSNNVSAVKQKAFLDGMAEWAMFANLQFIPYTNEPNYVLIYEATNLAEGGESAVGMVGGVQYIEMNPTSWNRPTICHELGHTLGLVHEMERSDRDSYVKILTDNIQPGQEGNFVLLTDSQNETPYDFRSIMHYSRTNLSVSAALNVIEPLPAYTNFLYLMGLGDPVLSADDRAGVAAIYGAASPVTSVVTNTADAGPGTLRAAMYYAYDHPGTTITFNIPVTDPGYSNSVFNILLSDTLPSLWGNTTNDATTEPVHSNPNGPAILLSGGLTWPLDNFPSGLRFRGTNSRARGFVINDFPESAILIDGTNTVGNTISGCYLGIDTGGTTAVPDGICPVQISGGAVSNLVGGTTVAARNVIGGGVFQGIAIRDPGTSFNVVQGNYIGLNAAGAGAISNTWAGIQIFNGAQSNLIGGYTASARNVISGNGLQGVAISDTNTSGNIVAGNYLGLNPAGTAAMGNGLAGVNVFGGATRNFIGGNVPGAGNVISGNGAQGVLIQYDGTDGNFVQGNLIGLDAAGDAAVSNAWSGVEINNGPSGNLIGGYGGARNFISGNGNYGVYIDFANGNTVQGNTIGLDATNGAVIPNGFAAGFAATGIYEASSNLFGGTFPGAANIIVGSPYVGVQVSWSATNNTIRGNSIFGNFGGAIAEYEDGNNELAAPSLTSAVVTTNTVVSGNYDGAAGQTYWIDFYSDAPSDPTAGCMTYLGAISVTGTGSVADFTAGLGVLLPAGRVVTATATDAEGNTSQTSGGVADFMQSTPNDGIPDAWRARYFGGSGATTNSQSASFADPDQDGMSNYQEFLAGTNPTNAASVFQLTSLNPATSTNVVSLNSTAGIVYRIQSRDDLVTGNWAILADQVIGTGTNLVFYDPAEPVSPRRFYRAQVLW